jgi:amidohydrolase
MIDVDELISIRRDLHSHPELAFEEVRTASVVAGRLRELGLDVASVWAERGSWRILGAPSRGLTSSFAQRWTVFPWRKPTEARSATRPGVMHACGHDGHTPTLLAVAAELVGRRQPIPGLIRFLFQPAEEVGAGAEAMLKDGALDGAEWDAMLAMHLRPFLTAGPYRHLPRVGDRPRG